MTSCWVVAVSTTSCTRRNSASRKASSSGKRVKACATLSGFRGLSGRFLVPRTKMTRHQLKEQDEITTFLERYTELVVARKKEVTIGLSVLAVLVIAIFGWSFYSSRRNAAAQAQLSQAINIYNDTVNIKSDNERYEKTIAEAQKTHDQYASLPAG